MFCKLGSPSATETLPVFQGESDKDWVGKNFFNVYNFLTYHRCLAPCGGYLNLLDESKPVHKRKGCVTKKSLAGASVQLSWLQHWEVSLELVSVLREPWAVTICH